MAFRLRQLFTNLKNIKPGDLYSNITTAGFLSGGVIGSVIGVGECYMKPDRRKGVHGAGKTVEMVASGTGGFVVGGLFGTVVAATTPIWIPVYAGIKVFDTGIKIYDAIYKIESIYSEISDSLLIEMKVDNQTKRNRAHFNSVSLRHSKLLENRLLDALFPYFQLKPTVNSDEFSFNWTVGDRLISTQEVVMIIMEKILDEGPSENGEYFQCYSRDGPFTSYQPERVWKLPYFDKQDPYEIRDNLEYDGIYYSLSNIGALYGFSLRGNVGHTWDLDVEFYQGLYEDVVKVFHLNLPNIVGNVYTFASYDQLAFVQIVIGENNTYTRNSIVKGNLKVEKGTYSLNYEEYKPGRMGFKISYTSDTCKDTVSGFIDEDGNDMRSRLTIITKV